MALTITWPTPSNGYVGNIFVPKADMTLIAAGPPEFRGLDMNYLRGEVSLLWASAVGAYASEPFKHIRESTLSGNVYARQVRWLPPYTITFEPGLYTVVTAGANHNTADVQVQNGVGIVTQNSGGLLNNNADLAMQVWATDLSAVTVEGEAGTMLRRVFEMMGLRLGSPYVNAASSITVAGMTFTVIESPPGTFTLTRTT